MKRLLFLIAVVLVGCGSTTRTLVPETTHTGKLRFTVADTEPKATEYNMLEEASGKRYRLFFQRPVNIPPANSAVSVHGRLEGKAIRNATITASVERSVKRTTTLGTKKIAWIVYTREGVAAPWTKAQIESVTLTGEISFKSFYEAASFNKLKIEGHVYGVYTVKTTECFDNLEAKAKAEADGYVPANFTNVQYLQPGGAGCEGAGQGDDPGVKSWIRLGAELLNPFYVGGKANEVGVHTMTHEVGHNFGLNHANAIYCHAGNVGVVYTVAETNCEQIQYYNRFDTMGSTGQGNDFNAPEKNFLGWWEPSQLKTVTTSGNYTVQPDETNNAGTHLLAIQRPNRPNGTIEYYYVEFHQPYLFLDVTKIQEQTPANYEGYYGGAQILLGAAPTQGSTFSYTWKLWMDPTVAEAESTAWSYRGIMLKPTQTYEDTESHLKIKTESVSEAGVVVKVSFQTGAPEPPTFTGAKYFSQSQAGVEWERSPTATKYEVFRRPFGSTEFTKVAETTTALHVVNEVTPSGNNIWQYCVKAVNASGKSECSSISTAFLQTSSNGSLAGWVETPTKAVVGAKVSATFGGITLSTWTGYRGYYRLDLPGGKTWKVVVSGTGYSNKESEAILVTNKTTVYSPFLGPLGGVNSHGNRSEVLESEVKTEYTKAAELKAVLEREDVYWQSFEPTSGTITCGTECKRFDLLVDEAASHNIMLTGTIVEIAHWTNSGCGDCAPTTPSVEQGFVERFLARVTPAGTKYSSVFAALANYNEPNLFNNLKKPNNTNFATPLELAEKYTAMSNAIYEGVKKVAPQVDVLFGETGICDSCSITFKGKEFYDNLLNLGIKYTAMGLHAYSEGTAPEAGTECSGYPETGKNATQSTKCKVEKAHTILANHGVPNVPIWVNEWGFTCETEAEEKCKVPQTEAYETKRAEYTQKTVEMLNNHTTFPYVGGWAYYQLHDKEGSKSEEAFGLLKHDLTERPSFAAFKAGMK